MARVLGAVRQSKTRDRALSPEVQRKDISRWTENNAHTLVQITEDLSRSGKVSAFNRPKLGPWLTEPELVASWDILVTTKLTRACRDAYDFLRLREWCQEHGKIYVSLAENIDLSTAAGRYAATQWAAAAEFERERMSEQRLETLAELEEQGRWKGGRLGYGLRVLKTDAGCFLEVDDGGTAEIAREMARMATDGHSNGQIAGWLNEHGHKTTAGGTWTADRVRLVLWSPNMTKILSDEDHATLIAALQSRQQIHAERVGGHMLLHVAYCANDGSPLYGNLRSGRAHRNYYRCLKCGINVRMEKLEDFTVGSLLFVYGDDLMKRKVVTPGDTRAQDIKSLEHDLAKLKAIDDQSLVESVIADAEARLAELHSRPYTPPKVDWKKTKQTVAQYWASLETRQDQGKFLRDAKIKVTTDGHQHEFRVTEAGMLKATHLEN